PGARVVAGGPLAPHHPVLARADPVEERVARRPHLGARADGGVEREVLRAQVGVDVPLHREEVVLRILLLAAIADQGRGAQVDPELDPVRLLVGPVEERAVAAELAYGVARLAAAVAVDEPAAGRRDVAQVAARVAGRELELRVGGGGGGGGGQRGGGRRRGGEHLQLHRAPSRIQRSMSAMSASGSGRSGGIARGTSTPVSRYMRRERSGWPGST